MIEVVQILYWLSIIERFALLILINFYWLPFINSVLMSVSRSANFKWIDYQSFLFLPLHIDWLLPRDLRLVLLHILQTSFSNTLSRSYLFAFLVIFILFHISDTVEFIRERDFISFNGLLDWIGLRFELYSTIFA